MERNEREIPVANVVRMTWIWNEMFITNKKSKTQINQTNQLVKTFSLIIFTDKF